MSGHPIFKCIANDYAMHRQIYMQLKMNFTFLFLPLIAWKTVFNTDKTSFTCSHSNNIFASLLACCHGVLGIFHLKFLKPSAQISFTYHK